ncbi:MAG: type II toxin-antitoxin system VapC family toxin [Alphaproteobacteria bacterium]|nr:type II toxin-antitoxin system VapC family toxin [Alphaproteobacteria bacterium]
MVVDSSAIIAVLIQEDDADAYAQAIESVETPLISAASVVEAGIVLCARFGPAAIDDLRSFLDIGGFQVVEVTVEQSWTALDAFVRFGKGQNAAALNYGDCFVYALARAADQPLLFKGGDFAKTDLEAVS